ncbi:MAG: thioredoxin family protein [Candidatus Spechtbacterales bacterium]|nr:thioredoxin family protein [Candidatus Spechtbacterales bacterium]
MQIFKQNEGMTTPAIIGIVVVTLVLGGVIYYNMRPEGEKMMEEGEEIMKEGEDMMEEGEKLMEEGDKMMEEGEKMMEDDEGAMMEDGGDHMMEISYKGEVLAGSSAPLINFNQSDYEKALSSGDLVVLYFYANWCPVCKEEVNNALYPAFNELNKENVVGFRVNFNDNETSSEETALAREFGVAYQHTKVFVRNGERILKAPDSWNKQRYFDEINKVVN